MAAKVKGGIEGEKWKQMSDTSSQRILLGAELLPWAVDLLISPPQARGLHG